jgi:hypothetical protein
MKMNQSRPFHSRLVRNGALRVMPRAWLALAAATAALASPLLHAASNPASQGKDIKLRILSSPAE